MAAAWPGRLRVALRGAVPVAACTLALLGWTGCAREEEQALPVACEISATELLDALATAPEPVTVGGERISACIDQAATGGEIQRIGAGLTGAADELARAAPDDPQAALAFGYLVGAVQRGSSEIGIHDELARRIADAVPRRRLTGASRAAYRRGLAAGRSTG